MPEITVKGMSCGAAAALTKALESLPGVTGVQVDLVTGRSRRRRPVHLQEEQRVITAAGYELIENYYSGQKISEGTR
jgi:copper chaperone CopZ